MASKSILETGGPDPTRIGDLNIGPANSDQETTGLWQQIPGVSPFAIPLQNYNWRNLDFNLFYGYPENGNITHKNGTFFMTVGQRHEEKPHIIDFGHLIQDGSDAHSQAANLFRAAVINLHSIGNARCLNAGDLNEKARKMELAEQCERPYETPSVNTITSYEELTDFIARERVHKLRNDTHAANSLAIETGNVELASVNGITFNFEVNNAGRFLSFNTSLNQQVRLNEVEIVEIPGHVTPEELHQLIVRVIKILKINQHTEGVVWSAIAEIEFTFAEPSN